MSLFVRTFLFILIFCLGTFSVLAQTEGGKKTVRINPDTEAVEASEVLAPAFVSFEKKDIPAERLEKIQVALTQFAFLRGEADRTLERENQKLQGFIKKSIEQILLTKPQDASALQRLVDPVRRDTLETLQKRVYSFENIRNPELLEDDKIFLEERIALIQDTLEKKSGVELDSSVLSLEMMESLTGFKEVLIRVQESLREVEILDLMTDRDRDGLSDFVEVILSQTEENKNATAGGSTSDLERLLLGKDAGDLDLQDIVFRDVYGQLQDVKKVEDLTLSAIEKRISETTQEATVILEGYSIPLSVLQIYIYPLNLIAIVSVDEKGFWQHRLAENIEEGEYEAFLVLTESDGYPIVRSSVYALSISEVGASGTGTSGILKTKASDSDGYQSLSQGTLEPFIPETPVQNLSEGFPEEINQVLENIPLGESPFARFIRQYFLMIAGGIGFIGIFISIILLRGGSEGRSTYYSTMGLDGPSVAPARKSLYASLDVTPEANGSTS